MLRSKFRTIIILASIVIMFSSKWNLLPFTKVATHWKLKTINNLFTLRKLRLSSTRFYSQIGILHSNSKSELSRELLESNALSKVVQKRISDLQNPNNCQTMKKILCRLPISGFGSQAHLLTICFTIGFHTKRTVILFSNTSKYSKDGWNSFMLPISDTCTTININQTVVKVTNLTRIADISVIDIDLAHNYIDLSDAIPHNLFLKIQHFNSNPSLWWAGQIALYVFKPTDEFKYYLNKRRKELGIQNLFVGVHIRRTDKINEAKYINISKYMDVVDEWYTLYEKSHARVQRKIFLATDEPNVVHIVKHSYPNYHIINDFNATLAASQKITRYTLTSLKMIIQDIHFLSMSNFLVCTMSSNTYPSVHLNDHVWNINCQQSGWIYQKVCRLAYELMQARYGNASKSVKSLDKCYFIYGLTPYLC